MSMLSVSMGEMQRRYRECLEAAEKAVLGEIQRRKKYDLSKIKVVTQKLGNTYAIGVHYGRKVVYGCVREEECVETSVNGSKFKRVKTKEGDVKEFVDMFEYFIGRG